MAAPPRVAIVGGGIAGSLCALALRQRGAEPTIIDMGRRAVGGRLAPGRSARKAPLADMGAQFFCADHAGADSHFGQVMGFLEQNHCVARWEGRFGLLGARGGGFLPKGVIDGTVLGGLKPDKDGVAAAEGGGQFGDFCGFLSGGSRSRLFVGTPSMGSVCERLTAMAEVPVRLGVEITEARLGDGGWRLADASGAAAELGTFDALVLASHNPALAAGCVRRLAADLHTDVVAGTAADSGEVQGQRIVERLRGLSDALQALRDSHKAPLCSLAVELPAGALATAPFDAVACPTSRHLQFIAREASKPGRGGAAAAAAAAAAPTELVTAVSTSAFAQELLQMGQSEEDVARELTEQLLALLRPCLGEEAKDLLPISTSARIWRAGFTTKSLGLQEDTIGLEPWRLAVCGDFVRSHASPLEAAAVSGMEAGERVAAWFAAPAGPQ